MGGKVKMPTKKGSSSGGRRVRGSGKKGANPHSVPDHQTLRARKEGYPARSVYKLEEIQKKYRVFPWEGRVLDVGAAPGSWSLYILRNLSPRGFLAAVDLQPLDLKEESDHRYRFLQGDFFDDDNLRILREWGAYEAILSDAAPATSGNRILDTGRSASLAEGLLHQTQGLLKPGGNLVVKIFLGGREQDLLARFRETFDSVGMFKPRACRKGSFETYLIGRGFRPSGEN